MAYLITASERTRSSASDFETKALLYLMNLSINHEETFYYVIDVFNDVTAHSLNFDKSWDLQSKASKTSCAKDIGRELVTLFKNYLSEFSFDYSILFIGGVPDSFRIDNTQTTFMIGNVTRESINSLRDGLFEEASSKSYIDNSKFTIQTVDDFLNKVTFVIDDKTRIEYMHNCIGAGKRIIPRDAKLEKMFASIKSIQQSRKDRKNIDGIQLHQVDDVLFLGRHLLKDNIKLKILSDLIGESFSKNVVPNKFIDVLNEYSLESDQREDIVEECFLNLCKVYFDLNNEVNFWKLFSHLYLLIESNKDKNVNEIYELSDKRLFKNVRNLQPNTSKYFIALIMEATL